MTSISGHVRTMNHTVESCPLTRFTDGDLFRLHSTDHAISWLYNVAVKPIAKRNEEKIGVIGGLALHIYTTDH